MKVASKREPLPLLVYSHLRWDFVYQRPQQLLSRLARDRTVLFIEEPVPSDAAPYLELSVPEPGLTRCLPRGAFDSQTFGAAQVEDLLPLMQDVAASLDVATHVAWMYTPMALSLAKSLEPASVVYDCMDELSAFDGAPPALREREAELFTIADLVFTGGPSLYRAKRGLHPRVYCFPSSVDVAHFAKGRTERLADPNRPRLGFYGVIDERIDRKILATVAEQRPHWQIDMVGPIVKIDPATLPRPHNIHYLGQRSYADLPAHIAEWDVCLMPFAMNAATRFISPTKVLEYMAAERPIVSTPIADVAQPYGDVVRIAASADEFIAACDASLSESRDVRALRKARMRDIVARTSWERTVTDMAHLLSEGNQREGESQCDDTTRSSSAPVLRA